MIVKNYPNARADFCDAHKLLLMFTSKLYKLLSCIAPTYFSEWVWQTFSHRYSHRTRTTLAQARSTRQLTGTHGSMHRLYFFNIFLHMALLCKEMFML